MGLLFPGRSLSIQVSVQQTDAAGVLTFLRILIQSIVVAALHFSLLFSQPKTETNARVAMESTSKIAWCLNSVPTLACQVLHRRHLLDQADEELSSTRSYDFGSETCFCELDQEFLCCDV